MKILRSNLIQRVVNLGVAPDDDGQTRTWKNTLNLGLTTVLFVLIPIGLLYLAFGESDATSAYLSFSLACVVFMFYVTLQPRQYEIAMNVLAVIALVTHQWASASLGGFVNSGGVVLWGFPFPVVIMMLAYGVRRTILWFGVTAANVIISILLSNPAGTNLPPWLIQISLASNIILILGFMTFPLMFFFTQRNVAFSLLRGEQEKSENLLLNILPKDIAAILKNEQRTIADHFEGASILFADVVNFTPMSAQMTPVELVELLNEVFSHFDSLVEKYGLEKIKTIGDCYMVASGVPRPRPDHAQVLTQMALEMQQYVSEREFKGRRLAFRIGINSGPVVAGVIGRKKFIYDLWGDAVNTASRMESHGSSGLIQITRATYELIKDEFMCEPKGTVNVKGKGEMEVWYVTAQRG